MSFYLSKNDRFRYNDFIQNNHRNEVSVMFRIISFIITFLNRINKFIWKIIIAIYNLTISRIANKRLI